MITATYELEKPDRLTFGTTLCWYVRIKAAPSYFLCNDGTCKLMNIANCVKMDLDKEIYFKNEATAHEHAAMYYLNCNKTYPYMDEWIAAGCYQPTLKTNVAVPEQQRMRFG